MSEILVTTSHQIGLSSKDTVVHCITDFQRKWSVCLSLYFVNFPSLSIWSSTSKTYLNSIFVHCWPFILAFSLDLSSLWKWPWLLSDFSWMETLGWDSGRNRPSSSPVDVGDLAVYLRSCLKMKMYTHVQIWKYGYIFPWSRELSQDIGKSMPLWLTDDKQMMMMMMMTAGMCVPGTELSSQNGIYHWLL